MKIFNYSNKISYEVMNFPKECKKSDELFVLCRNNELSAIKNVFNFDESTIIDCADLDESIRYNSFNNYDFISVVHVELLESEFQLREINLYISRNYLVLVIPEHNSPRLLKMERKLLNYVKIAEERTDRINALYYSVFHYMLVDFSEMLEVLEDRMQGVSDEIVNNVNKDQFNQINFFRNMAYAVKKQLRALTYLGEQILLDENKIISKGQTHYFRNINTRFKKLYDFSESIYNLSSQMLYTYDSRLSMKTNDSINKLTAMTLLFGPLTVITGIYGMNFDFMPELHWKYGYPLAIAFLITVSVVLIFILKKKNWL